MSYTVEVPTTVMGPSFDPHNNCATQIDVTTFAGGDFGGRMVQIGMPFEPMACLTMEQLDVLIDVLTHAREHSLIDHPLRDAWSDGEVSR